MPNRLNLSIYLGIGFIIFNLSSFSAYAEKSQGVIQCQEKHSVTSKRYLSCLDGVSNQLQRDLKSWENNVIFKLEEAKVSSGSDESIVGFKKNNKTFEHYKKVTCQWQYKTLLPDITRASSSLKECEITMYQNRISTLMAVSELELY